MNCARCNSAIDPGEEREYRGQVLCEDCHLDELSPVRVCDPWAVYCAKSLEQHGGGAPVLTPIQSEIIRVLTETGAMGPEELLARLPGEMTYPQLEREFAALRHMEKVRGERKEGKVFIRLW